MTDTTPVDPAAIAPGDLLPTMTRLGDFHAWNRYAAVNYEFVPIHMDDEAGRAAGYPAAFGMGNIQFSYLHDIIRTWMGDGGGRIVKLSCQFRGAFVRGRTVTAHAVVAEVDRSGDETVVELELWTEDDTGARLAPGKATVAFSS
ncbi:MAG: MaoC/PaaZ C-terminal domain-containing protein [Acidimicrobiia bacterium]